MKVNRFYVRSKKMNLYTINYRQRIFTQLLMKLEMIKESNLRDFGFHHFKEMVLQYPWKVLTVFKVVGRRKVSFDENC